MTNTAPQTLIEAVGYFADEDVALEFVATLRWPEERQVCPHCGVEGEHYFLSIRRKWKCRDCKRQFSVKVGTIFKDSPISLSKWLPVMWLIANCKNGISSCELTRALGVTQKTAWFVFHCIRLAMQSESFDKMTARLRSTRLSSAAKRGTCTRRSASASSKDTGGMGKVALMGLLERHGQAATAKCSKVRTRVIQHSRRWSLHAEVREHVESGSRVYTDALRSYEGLNPDYIHAVIDHAEKYGEGNVHTNGLENFWSLFTRGVKGTYVSVAPFHLFRYLDEQTFRFNLRKDTDLGRFVAAVASIVDRRITYTALPGKGALLT